MALSLRKHFTRHQNLLTDIELGGEDVGIESELGEVKACDVYEIQMVSQSQKQS